MEDIAVLLHSPSDRLIKANLLKDPTLHLGQNLIIPVRAEEWLEPTPTPFPKTPLPVKPLSDRSTIQEVLSRMHASKEIWHTAWLDLYYLTLGPAGYAGPPQQNHIQLWISRPGKLFVISQDTSSEHVRSQLVRDGLSFNFDNPIIQVQRVPLDEDDPFLGWFFNLSAPDLPISSRI
jgi:hypothetical protein